MKRILLLLPPLVLIGAGCDLSAKVTFQSPFRFSVPAPVDATAATSGITRTPGLSLTIQPSYLGVSGTVADVIGDASNAKIATITEASDGTTALSWTHGDRKGTVRARGMASAEAMFLPAFWKDGEETVEQNGLLWLPPEGFRELAETGQTEWRVGIAEETLGAASKLLQLFNAASAKLSGTASATATTPFTMKFRERIASYPIRVDGSLEQVRAVKASSWFGDYLILDNAEHPLILRVSVNPLALGALDAFTSLGVDAKGVGYEIVAVKKP